MKFFDWVFFIVKRSFLFSPFLNFLLENITCLFFCKKKIKKGYGID